MSRIPIFLREYEATALTKDQFSEADATLLWGTYQNQLSVQFPSLPTGNRWILKPKGWVGRIPLIGYDLILQPKVAVSRLFHLLFQLYDLDWRWGEKELVGVKEEHLGDWLDLLARQFAQECLAIGRRGIYQDYEEIEDSLPFVRGRLLLNKKMLPAPTVDCRYYQLGAGVLENRLIAFTLEQLLMSHHFQLKSRSLLRQAYHQFRSFSDGRGVELVDFSQVSYHRLNRHYQWAHRLGYFFLAHLGPTYLFGERQVRPFLLNMNRFYEQYVADRLARLLPAGWQLKEQELLRLGVAGEMQMFIDLLLFDPAGRAVAVLDTKYKLGDKVDNRDVYQVAFYAAAKECRHAFLLYPEEVKRPLDIQLEGVRVRTVTFSLAEEMTLDWLWD